jgi:RHS repeat-associated protein
MTDRDGELVQHYGYHAFGNERYKQNTQAFGITNRYTGQELDEDTGLYFYQSRYGACPERSRRNPALARFVQADTIVPSSSTGQALNRYAYVKNNPLRFTDPSGHGLFDFVKDIFNSIKKFAGIIFGTALLFTPLAPIAPFLGSLVNYAVNGGNFGSFIVGVGISIAAGVIGSALGSAALSGLGIAAKGASDFIFAAFRGAVIGAISGAINSLVYGQNVEKGLAMGAAWGAGIGAASDIYENGWPSNADGGTSGLTASASSDHQTWVDQDGRIQTCDPYHWVASDGSIHMRDPISGGVYDFPVGYVGDAFARSSKQGENFLSWVVEHSKTWLKADTLANKQKLGPLERLWLYGTWDSEFWVNRNYRDRHFYIGGMRALGGEVNYYYFGALHKYRGIPFERAWRGVLAYKHFAPGKADAEVYNFFYLGYHETNLQAEWAK